MLAILSNNTVHISITWLKSARRSSSKTSRPFHHPSGISGSLETAKSGSFGEVIGMDSVTLLAFG